MNIFDFVDYKKFVLYELKKKPKNGHGQFLKIAKHLNIHTTMVTHVLKGHLHLSMEQCLALSEYLGLNELETEYMISLLHLSRSSNQKTKQFYTKQISLLKDKALNISLRLEIKNSLSESDQAIYYSSWIYSACRLLTAIPAFQDKNIIAEKLNLPMLKMNSIFDFLISRGLCKEVGNKIIYGDVSTYVNRDSSLAVRHHVNWRLKVMEQLEGIQEKELAYTYPVVISEKDFLKIREEIVLLIEKIKEISDPSPSDKLYCLNIDWMQIKF